jgi:hypothetical protein
MAWIGLLAAGVLGTGSAYAVSDGDYNNKDNGCSGGAFNANDPDRAEEDCRSLVFKLVDASGHEYFSVGIPETPDGESADELIACFDLGTGKKQCAHVGKGGTHRMAPRRGTPAHPATGLRAYFGANDNLDGGEHDSSSLVDNGPSDGGGIQANASKDSLTSWLAAARAGDRSYLLTHPLPGADAGTGFCADGLCFSAQTQRRVAYQGTSTDPNDNADVANYGNHEWDPQSCSGATNDDDADSCGGQPITYWEEKNGSTYVEPGIQIYEDPDPQGSPIGPYPIPALYIGTCGLVVGGGPVHAPASPFTNAAGQLVVSTGC